MISRLTFSAAVFAAIATVSLAYAADSAQQQQAVENAPAPPPRRLPCRRHAHGRSDRPPYPLRIAHRRARRPREPRLPGRTSVHLVRPVSFARPCLAPGRAKSRAKALKESPPVPK